MSAASCNLSCNPRTLLMDLALRGSLTALGLLCVALLTATAASAQQSQSGDLSVVGSVGPNPVAAGATVAVSITVTNNGPDAASTVAMVYLFPPDTGGIGPGSTPAGWTCSLGVNSLQCTIPTLAASASA